MTWPSGKPSFAVLPEIPETAPPSSRPPATVMSPPFDNRELLAPKRAKPFASASESDQIKISPPAVVKSTPDPEENPPFDFNVIPALCEVTL